MRPLPSSMRRLLVLFALTLTACGLGSCDTTPAPAQASCDDGPPHARDLLPPDELPPTTFSYRAYDNAQSADAPPSSVSYIGSASVTPSSECVDGVRRLILTGDVQAARTADGEAPESVTGGLTLSFRVTRTEVTVTYTDPFVGPPTGDSFVVGPVPREAGSSVAETYAAIVAGCEPSASSARFLPGGGFLALTTACTTDDGELGITASGATLTVLN